MAVQQKNHGQFNINSPLLSNNIINKKVLSILIIIIISMTEIQTTSFQKLNDNDTQLLPQHFHTLTSTQSVTYSSLDHQNSWMDEYLNPEVFDVNNPQNLQVSNIQAQENTSLCPSDEQQRQQGNSEPLLKNKSIFHNFQKHLITLIKKIINIKRSELVNNPSGIRAYDLWKIFKATQSTSKKILYIIFGVAQQQNDDNLRKVAQEIPELQKLLAKYQMREIEDAQALLRQVVGYQTRCMPKRMIKSQCKMGKFQEFYSYYVSFISELENGGISKRMTKQRKMQLLEDFNLFEE